MKQNESPFKFNDYKIVKSYIEFPAKGNSDQAINIEIKPSGIRDGNLFRLTLDTTIKNNTNTLNLNVVMVGEFEFRNIPEEKLGIYFIVNAPAIMFPYIRSYISTLSSLSGIPTIILPTLNMTSLAEELSKNIVGNG